MNKRSGTSKEAADKLVRGIKRKTRKHYSAEEKIRIDIAKSVFQLHGIYAHGAIVLQKKLRRGAVLKFLSKLEPCLIGMEACATSHYWARKIAALGHDVKMIPPAYGKPYSKHQKNDAADAEAICEAVTRPNMRFVPM